MTFTPETIATPTMTTSIPRRVSLLMDDETDTRDNKTVRFALPEPIDNMEQVQEQAQEEPIRWLSDEDCRERWYQRDELSAMKRAVRMAILYGISDEAETNAEDTPAYSFGIGLGRFSLERSQHKRSAIYHILMAQQHVRQRLDLHPNNINMKNAAADWIYKVASRCTAWARHVAAEEGFAIYCEVYGDPIVEENENHNSMSSTNTNWSLFQEYANDILTMTDEHTAATATSTTTTVSDTKEEVDASDAPHNHKRKLLDDLEPINLSHCHRNVRPRLDSTPSTPVVSA